MNSQSTNNQPTVTLDDLLAQVVQVQENAAQWEKDVKGFFQSMMEQRTETTLEVLAELLEGTNHYNNCPVTGVPLGWTRSTTNHAKKNREILNAAIDIVNAELKFWPSRSIK